MRIWIESEAHLLFLSKFRRVQDVSHVAADYWESPLGEPPMTAIDRFIREGALLSSPLSTKIDRAFSIAELKLQLRQHSLPVSGKKQALVERLVAADRVEMTRKVAHLNFVQCATEGLLIVEKYLSESKARKAIAVANSLALVKARMFRESSLDVARYEAKQVFPRGVGINWQEHDCEQDVEKLQRIFNATPKILDGLPDNEWEPLRIACAMMHLWGTGDPREWLPDDLVGLTRFNPETAVRMLLFNVGHTLNLKRYARTAIRNVTISACGDRSCEACQAISGRTISIDEAPELPYAACTNEFGCRCHLSPVFDD